LTAEVERRFGSIDVYVANAGVNVIGPFEAVTEGQFDEVFGVNVKGVFFGVQKALPLLKDGSSVVLRGCVRFPRAIPRWNERRLTPCAATPLGPVG
jgi:NAD(P)-dependent dehydrogenase (short-subunit alcohol dehydrogenase family)